MLQAWGVLEHSEGNLKRAREMFQQGVWAQPKGRDVGTVWQVLPSPTSWCWACPDWAVVHEHLDGISALSATSVDHPEPMR